MIVLAFDTALAACSVAVWRDGAVLAMERRLMERGQAEHLVPIIAAVMDRAGIGFDALDRIAVTVGPGSFTGVRVGLATARGLALAYRIPVIGVTTGEVLAAEAAAQPNDASGIVSLLDSKRGDLYVECFSPTGAARGTAIAMPAAAVGPWLATQGFAGSLLLVGDGMLVNETRESPARFCRIPDVVFPDPAVLAGLAAARVPSDAGPVPLYVRPPDVTAPAANS